MKPSHAARKLVAATLAVAGLALVGAAAPTAANASDVVDGKPREIRQSTGVYSTPRFDSPSRKGLQVGLTVQAYCGFSNAGSEWVKIYADEQFGFVPSTVIEGGTTELPTECPSEITTVPRPVLSGTVSGGSVWVPIEEFECPADYPFILNERLSNRAVIPGIEINAHERLTAHIVANKFVTRDEVSYVSSAYGNLSAWEHTDTPVGIVAYCTSDPRKALKASGA